MKIQSINNIKLNKFTQKTKNSKNPSAHGVQIKELANIPTKNYLAFLGGYSLSLEDTANNLSSSQYPENIENMVQEILNNGNEDKKTLYEVHFEKYKGVLDCYSLDELKEKYPEFKDVVSAYTVETKPNTPVSRFQSGSSKVFPQSEDLTLQLIKLYWGKGFSLTDISNYVKENDPEEISNFYYTITNKLNIPLMDRKYAQVLKLSNKEYNEKFTAELAQKLKDARDEKEQKRAGEAIFIPRRPLSDTHKKHISDSLIKHYSEHPEKIYELSQRQKEYYEEHPEQKEIVSEALDYAWNKTHDGQTVKKAIVKYAAKTARLTNEDLTFKNDLTPQKRNALKEFWNKNTWARGKFSSALKDGWEYAKFDVTQYVDKALQSMPHFRIAPERQARAIQNYSASKGERIPSKYIGVYLTYTKKLSKIEQDKLNGWGKKIDNCMNDFTILHPDEGDAATTAKQVALIQAQNALENDSSDLPKSLSSAHKIALLKAFRAIQESIKYYTNSSYGKRPVNGIGNNTLTDVLANIYDFVLRIDCPEFGEYITKKMNTAYEQIINKDYSFLNENFAIK